MRWLLAVLLLAACTDKTALFVEIDSQLTVPQQIDQVEIRATGLESGAELVRVVDLDEAFPQTFSLLPKDGRVEPVMISVTGLLEGDAQVRRSLRSAFRDGSEVYLQVELTPECLGVLCPFGVDCLAGRCIRDPAADAATPDGGMPDAETDAMMRPDAPPQECEDPSECDDGDACNGLERCELGVCVFPGRAECDDTVACTINSCEDSVCVFIPDSTACAPGDTCDPVFGCGGRECDDADDCANGGICNGIETCDSGQCVTHPAPSCDDGVPCTVDRCDDTAGACVHEPRNESCDDGQFCNGAETCDAEDGCRAGTAPTCNDSNACTVDSCEGVTPGACVNRGRDDDGDGHFASACAPLPGADDCDDSNPGVHPGAPDLCGGGDENCNGAPGDQCYSTCDTRCAGTNVLTGRGNRVSLPLTASSTTSGTCGGAGPEGRVAFSLAAPSDVLILTHGSDYDTVLYVRACACDGPEIGCNDEADGIDDSPLAGAAVLRFRSLPAGLYTVFVDTKTAAATGTVRADIYISPPGVPGDDCGNALPMTDSPLRGSTCGAADDHTLSCGSATSASGLDRVYYTVFGGDPRPLSLSTCGSATTFDSMLDMRPVCTDARSSERIACDDDSCGAGGASRITPTVGAGLYYVVVDGKSSSCGSYELDYSGF